MIRKYTYLDYYLPRNPEYWGDPLMRTHIGTLNLAIPKCNRVCGNADEKTACRRPLYRDASAGADVLKRSRHHHVQFRLVSSGGVARLQHRPPVPGL